MIDPLPMGKGGKLKFVVVAIDYFTKWVEAPLARMVEQKVANFIGSSIVCWFSIHYVLLFDNER